MTPNVDERVWVSGPEGRLEGRYRHGTHDASLGVLLCHPHPLFGGTLHNKTLFRIAKHLAAAHSIPSLRFNFRGTGDSEGAHDGGRGEAGDVRAGLEWLATDAGLTRLVLIGYSFGAVVGLPVGEADARVEALVALGLPLHHDWDLSFLDTIQKPICFVHGENDEFGRGDEMVEWADRLSAPSQVHVVAGGDHLFHGREDDAVDATVRFVAAFA